MSRVNGVVDSANRPFTASPHDSCSQALEECASRFPGEHHLGEGRSESSPGKHHLGEGRHHLGEARHHREIELSWRIDLSIRELSWERIISEKDVRLEEKKVRIEELTNDVARTVAQYCAVLYNRVVLDQGLRVGYPDLRTLTKRYDAF